MAIEQLRSVTHNVDLCVIGGGIGGMLTRLLQFECGSRLADEEKTAVLKKKTGQKAQKHYGKPVFMAGFSFLNFFHFCYCKLLTFCEFCGIILVSLIGGKKNMISRHKIYLKSGIVKTNVRIVDPYRPGPGLPPKQRQVKNFGYAEDYEDQEAFWKMVQEEDENFKASKKKISVDLDPAETLRDSKRWMLGHSYLNAIYDFLELDKFCEGIDTRAKYSLDEILRFLVCQRITDPDSLRASFRRVNSYTVVVSRLNTIRFFARWI